MLKNVVSCSVKGKDALDLFYNPDLHLNLTGCVLCHDPSCVHVSWKSVLYFLCTPADQPDDKWAKHSIVFDLI